MRQLPSNIKLLTVVFSNNIYNTDASMISHDMLCNSNCLHNNTRQKYFNFNYSRASKVLSIKLLLFILLILFLLIAAINSSLINPGPDTPIKGLSIFYQNVQGLIPFTDLNKNHPNLDNTKISEIHAFIYDKRPDIIIFNETWLKNITLDQEILPSDQYKIFRRDRSNDSHPQDLDNPQKFRRNGGGVLIAINCSLKVSSSVINLKCSAEMFAVEIVLGDGSKIVISTCYRVGTLGATNYHEIINTLQKLLRKKKLKKFFLIGDFNLRCANWEANLSSNSIEQMFLDGFLRLGLIQCVTSPTHFKNNILDILLTNSDNSISNIKVLSDQEWCKSDHFAVTFEIKLRVDRKKPQKTRSFNFKRANWEQLNIDLNIVDWLSFLDSLEPDLAWNNFKEILDHFLDIHVPKITIKHNNQPPWFDGECYVKCREKERLHKKFKRTKSINDEINFVNCRREFKSLVKSKMRDNLYCSKDNNVITKKFWAHVKSNSNTTRIPEVMKHDNSISSNNLAKANMFNQYFFDQFSSSSTYDINIDFSEDDLFDIDFSCARIKQLLDNINVNKAPGPDGIHGCVLKYCSDNLCRPLSIIFKLVYNTGILPAERKAASIV